VGSTLSLRVHPLELPVVFAGVRKNQVPFAASRALNSTAWAGSVELRGSLRQRFKVRSERPGKSIRGPAKNNSLWSHKRDWPHLSAGVGVLDQWLARHEEGGIQKPERASSFAVPTRVVAAKRNPGGSIPKRLRPTRLRANQQARRVDDAILDVRKNSLRGQRVLYLLRRNVRLTPRLGGLSTLDQVARAKFHEHFTRELTAALKSERVRAGSFTSAQGRFMWRKAAGLVGAH
jgi:hypothetical protein